MCLTTSPEDLFVWPCGTTCFRYEACEMSHMSDDYEVVLCDTPRWTDLCEDM